MVMDQIQQQSINDEKFMYSNLREWYSMKIAVSHELNIH